MLLMRVVAFVVIVGVDVAAASAVVADVFVVI